MVLRRPPSIPNICRPKGDADADELDEDVFSDAEEGADADEGVDTGEGVDADADVDTGEDEIDAMRARNAITASPAVNRDL